MPVSSTSRPAIPRGSSGELCVCSCSYVVPPRRPVAVTTIYMYNRSMEFKWDETKNQTNIRKHGIGFDTARRIFEGTVATSPDRRRDYGEDRHISIGRVEPGALIVVAHTERRGRIRLISARPASRKERKVYHERTLR